MTGQGIPLGLPDRQYRWFERLPGRWRAFAELARWDRPIGTWLLFWPCAWGLALAPGWSQLALLPLFALGAIAMRGAGCTINDLADRDFDARVERTRGRPLASGRLSVAAALGFLAAQLLVGLAVLLTLDRTAILLGFAIMPVVLVYPFMKRLTYWPQMFLAIAFNSGALIGFAAATGGLRLEAVLLYAAGMAWTLGYDTIYAHQDKEDDALIGVKSTALLFGARTPVWLAAFYALMVALLALAGWQADLGPLFFVGLAAIGFVLDRQIRGLDLERPAACLTAFRANREVGLWVWLALLAGKLTA